ncbi:MAG: uracil-DNA glycosylase family protein [Acidobacteriota bacterium]
MPDLFAGTSGPQDAKIAIVGESWGAEERRRRLPLVGQSGELCDSLLSQSGIERDDCFTTNLISEQPPRNNMWEFFYPTQEARANGKACIRGLYPKPNVVEGVELLRAQLGAVKPEVVIGFGNYTLWALTDDCFGVGDDQRRKVPTGITAWRGSQLYCREDMGGFPFMPTFHPAAAMRQWPWTYAIKHDLQNRLPKVFRNEWAAPYYKFTIRPSYGEVMEALDDFLELAQRSGPLRLSVDLETYAGHIDSLGLGATAFSAICIPFMSLNDPRGYWSPEEEWTIIQKARKLLSHPNVQIVGQNFLYDAQYFALYWNLFLVPYIDTMLLHHVCWPGTPKPLEYLSSLYCHYHRYWKSEDDEWQAKGAEDEHWTYNCKDVVATLEISYELEKVVKTLGLTEQAAFQMRQFPMVLRMMLRGINIDRDKRAEVSVELAETIGQYAARFEQLIPSDVYPPDPKKVPWYRSPQQQGYIFYDLLGVKEITKDKRRTVNDDALERIGASEPILRPIVQAIQEFRSVGVFYNTFCKKALDPDDRMRCSFNIAGTRTFRWNSDENAFKRGGNLQNIPSGTEEELDVPKS